MEEKVLTLHPQDKKGVNISRAKYDTVKGAILKELGTKEMTASELFQAIDVAIGRGFDGSVTWYTESIKLDLEARGIIERMSGKKPVYRLTRRSG